MHYPAKPKCVLCALILNGGKILWITVVSWKSVQLISFSTQIFVRNFFPSMQFQLRLPFLNVRLLLALHNFLRLDLQNKQSGAGGEGRAGGENNRAYGKVESLFWESLAETILLVTGYNHLYHEMVCLGKWCIEGSTFCKEVRSFSCLSWEPAGRKGWWEMFKNQI